MYVRAVTGDQWGKETAVNKQCWMTVNHLGGNKNDPHFTPSKSLTYK